MMQNEHRVFKENSKKNKIAKRKKWSHKKFEESQVGGVKDAIEGQHQDFAEGKQQHLGTQIAPT